MTENLRIGQPPMPPPAQPSPQRRPRTPRWQLLAAAVVGGLTVVVIGVAVLLVLRINPSDRGNSTSNAPSSHPAAPAPTSVEPATATYGTPSAKDFTLRVKILSKHCFGSAGCSIEFRVELTKVSGIELDPAKTYELTYDISGGEDPFTNTLEISGDQYQYDDKELIDTKSSKSILKAVITSVSER